MLYHYYVSAIRSLRKHRAHTFINLLGLSMSLAITFFIVQYVHYENSFDEYHAKKRELFRIGMDFRSGDNLTSSAGSYFGIGKQTKIDFGGVENYFTTTFNNAESGFMVRRESNGVKRFRLDKVFYASPGILEMLELDFLYGKKENGLEGLQKIVLSESTATKIFGEKNPLGQILEWFDNSSGDAQSTQYEVGAVVKDIPENSSFKFDLLFSMEAFEARVPALSRNAWAWSGFFNYVQLQSIAQKEIIERKLPEFLTRHAGSENERASNTTLVLEPITDIHLKSKRAYQAESGGSAQTLNVLIAVAILLIVLAYTNYFNLNATVSLGRARAVGMKRVMGAGKPDIIGQFLVESLLVNIIATALASLWVYASFDFIQTQIHGYPKLYLLGQVGFWALIFASIVLLSVAAALYPALVISNQKNIQMLKGSFTRSIKGSFLQHTMVVGQFLVSTTLILFTLVLNKQVKHMLSSDPGVNTEQVVVARAPFVEHGNYASVISNFQESVQNVAGIHQAAASTMIPGLPTWGNSIQILGSNKAAQYVNRIEVDEYYSTVYDHKILAGRAFSPEFMNDEHGVMINEKVCALLGMSPEEVVGQKVATNFDTLTVVGVFENYYHYSLKEELIPITFTKAQGDIYYLSIKLSTDNLTQSLQALEAEWDQHFPSSPFDYFFADNHFKQLYDTEQSLGKVTGFFSGVAMLIACMGLFGLSLFMIIKRKKEIGVRKVLGARGIHLFWVLARGLFRLIVLASVLGIPVAYWFSKDWLGSFSNQVEVHPLLYLIPLITSGALALIIIGYNVVKSLRTNPILSLREE